MSQTGSRAGTRRFQTGFTLVELMVTIFVAAILIVIAVPSFKHVTVSTRLTSTANSMVGALNMARMEAIKRNADTQFCGTTGNGADDLGTACGNTQAGAVYGLVGAASAASAIQIQAAPVISTTSLHLKVVNAIQFDAQGLGHLVGASQPYTGTVADICSSAVSTDNHRTIRMITGSILETATSKGSCP